MLLRRKHASTRGKQRYDRPIASNADKAAARKAAIERSRGMFAHLAPGRSLVDELIADRRAEARAEDLRDAKRRRRDEN
jgi:hypothetical protein